MRIKSGVFLIILTVLAIGTTAMVLWPSEKRGGEAEKVETTEVVLAGRSDENDGVRTGKSAGAIGDNQDLRKQTVKNDEKTAKVTVDEEYVGLYDIDSDGDGVSDGKEIELGSDPNVAQSEFEVEAIAKLGGEPQAGVKMVLQGRQVETLAVTRAVEDVFVTEEMPGYMGDAYDFKVDGDFDEAEIWFEFDAQDDVEPVIYYFNEDEQNFEALETRVEGNVARATTTHFSKYVLINRKKYEEAFRWEDTWSEGYEHYQGLEIVFLIDNSGSMEDNDALNQRLTVTKNLIRGLPQKSRVAVAKFTDSLTWFSHMDSMKSGAIAALTDENFRADGGTNMYSSILEAMDEFESDGDEALRVLVVLTDGIAGDRAIAYLADERAAVRDVQIHTVGLGLDTESEYFENYLRPLAKNSGGRFYGIDDAEQLETVYEAIGLWVDVMTDSDNDGITDYYEDNLVAFNGVKLKLDKNNPDSDGDGIPDGEEVELRFEKKDGKVKVTGKIKSLPYTADTDGDGWFDNQDKNPLKWDVGDRDLLMLASLAFENGSRLEQSFYTLNKNNEYRNHWMNFASLSELKGWKIVDYTSDWTLVKDVWDKFDATTYKNGDNIVIAYRGTNDGTAEWTDNVFFYGILNHHTEEGKAKEYAKQMYKKYVAGKKGAKLYITGHSLGGYLAQIGAAAIVQAGWEQRLARVAYMNGIGVGYDRIIDEFANVKDDDINALQKISDKLTSYYINGDVVSMLGAHYGAEIGFDATKEARALHRGEFPAVNFNTDEGRKAALNTFLLGGFSGLAVTLDNLDNLKEFLYYYDYYDTKSIREYLQITHERLSFYKYVTQGWRGI